MKIVGFKNPKYLGDPINIIKIFNEKEVDELILLDIRATLENRPPLFDYLSNLTNECFMPLTYGGGVRNVETVKRLLKLGIEKVAVNSYAVSNPNFVREVADLVGSQSIVASIDVYENKVYTNAGTHRIEFDPVEIVICMEQHGAGEILLNSIERDGTMTGYDLDLVERVAHKVSVPVIACGGARTTDDLRKVIECGASAAAVGSMFVFHGLAARY